MVYLSIPDLMGIDYNDFKNTLIDNNIPYSEIYFSSAIMKFIYIKTVEIILVELLLKIQIQIIR